MQDLTSQQISLKTAKAVAVVYCSEKSIEIIRNDSLANGNLFSIAKSAGFLGAKLTPQLLPFQNQSQLDFLDLKMEFLDQLQHQEFFETATFKKNGIVIFGEAKSIGRKGVEMEILTAVSIAAINIVNELNLTDENLEIGNIKIIIDKNEKKRFFATPPTCAVLVCSDSTAKGMRSDKSGILVKKMLEEIGAEVQYYQVLPDEKDLIQMQILDWVKKDIQFIFTTGGTGLGPRDFTVDAVKEILERDADGISEAIRVYGQQRTPMAMMSRAVAGSIKKTLIVTLPGSTIGAKESLEAIIPAVFHARKMMKSGGH